jgi:hypothetical protein
MPETPYMETEALLLAVEDARVDSGNTDALDAYLDTFFVAELLDLERAAQLLADRAHEIYVRKRRNA